jgi:hypothetical protein
VPVEPTPRDGGNAISTCNGGLREDPRENLRVMGMSQDVREVIQTYISDYTANCMHCKNIQRVIVAEDELELGCEVANSSAHHTEAYGGSWMQ